MSGICRGSIGPPMNTTPKSFGLLRKKYQVGIGYDYDVTVAKCEAKKKKPHKDDNIGGDAMELALNRTRR